MQSSPTRSSQRRQLPANAPASLAPFVGTYSGYRDDKLAIFPGADVNITVPSARHGDTERLRQSLTANGTMGATRAAKLDFQGLYVAALRSALKAAGVDDETIREVTSSRGMPGSGTDTLSLSTSATAKPLTVDNIARALEQVNFQATGEARKFTRTSTVDVAPSAAAPVAAAAVSGGVAASGTKASEVASVAAAAKVATPALSLMVLGTAVVESPIIPTASVADLFAGVDVAPERVAELGTDLGLERSLTPIASGIEGLVE